MNFNWQWWDQFWAFAQTVHIAYWAAAWWAVYTPFLIWLWRRRQKAVAATAVTGKHKTNKFALRIALASTLFGAAWLGFTLAQMDPKFSTVEQRTKSQAVEVCFVFDVSGSMFTWDVDSEELAPKVDAWQKMVYDKLVAKKKRFPSLFPNDIPMPAKRPDNVSPSTVQRLTGAKYIIWQVLNDRPPESKDRYAIIPFATTCAFTETLNSGRKECMDSLLLMRPENLGGGTNFDGEDGAIQTCIDHFREEGQAKVRVMCFVSDGDAGISPERQQYFVDQFTKRQPWQKFPVTHYICFLLAGPKDNVPPSLPELCKAVNPKTPFFEKSVRWVGNDKECTEAKDWLNTLVKSPIEEDPITKERSIRHEILIATLLTLAGCIVLCTVIRESY
jgi:hypothetical protein